MKLSVLVYRCLHTLASPLLCDLFCPRSLSSNRTTAQTRSQSFHGMVLPRAYTRYGLHSISFLAADRWNSLPPSLCASPSPRLFRIALLSWLGYPVRRRKSVGQP